MKSFLSLLIENDATGYQLRNQRTGVVLAHRLETAFDSKSRRTGLLRHTTLPDGSALVIAPSNAIHTFFMRFDIDVAFVAKNGRIVKIKTHLQPWRMAAALLAFAVVELPAGALDRSDTRRGDHLLVAPA
jgi:uncharacterized protein